MKQYTLGFIFDKSIQKVLLVHKLSPPWQNGLINGIGGKIEKGEDSNTCIVRETFEESGLKTLKKLWIYLGVIQAPMWKVEVFSYVYSGLLKDASTRGKENIEWFKVNKIPLNIVSNLNWLIPYAIDKFVDKELQSFQVNYIEGIKS